MLAIPDDFVGARIAHQDQRQEIIITKGEVDAPLTSVMGMKRRRLAC
jgi:hypothetical protein